MPQCDSNHRRQGNRACCSQTIARLGFPGGATSDAPIRPQRKCIGVGIARSVLGGAALGPSCGGIGGVGKIRCCEPNAWRGGLGRRRSQRLPGGRRSPSPRVAEQPETVGREFVRCNEDWYHRLSRGRQEHVVRMAHWRSCRSGHGAQVAECNGDRSRPANRPTL